MKIQAHYRARARAGQFPFLDDGIARQVWRRLRRAFPAALAVNLMPDHLHFVAPPGGERRLQHVLRATTRSLERPARSLWEPVLPANPITTLDKLRRNVRYIWLNPCRPWHVGDEIIQLSADPLAWRWSTLRDAVGAATPAWVSGPRLARELGFSRPSRMLDYTMRDEHVIFVPPPIRPPPSDMPDRPLDDVFAAVLEATRCHPADLRAKTRARRILVGLAYRQGWSCASALGRRLNMHANSVSRIARRGDRTDVEVAALCLDARLRAPRTDALRPVQNLPPAWAA